MASTQSVIDIIFNGIDNASGAANDIVKSFDDLNSAAADIAEPFADLADQLAIVQGVMIALAGVMGTLAYQEAIRFESSMLGLQKQMDENEGSAKDFSAVLEDLAIKYGTNANELVDSTADFKAASFDLDTSVQLVEQSLKLMIAGDVSAAQATDILKNSLAGFGIENDKAAESAQRIADVLNKVADISEGGFQDLAEGFAQLAPIGKLTGQTFEEMAAALSVVIDAGKTGSQAATGLQTSYLSLIKPVGDAADAMKALGVTFDSVGKPIGSVQDIITTMAPKWAELTKEQKLFTAATIVGENQAGIFVTVMEEQATILNRVQVAMKNAGGSIDSEVTIRLASAQQQIASTNEAWRQFLRALGDQFQVDTTGVISSLGALAISFKQIIEGGGLDPLFDLLRPQLADLEKLLRTVAENLPAAFADIDFSSLVKSFETLGVQAKKALEALFGPIDLSTVEGLRTAIQNVLDVITGIVNVTAGELGGLAPFLSGIRELTTAFKNATPEAQGYIGTLLGFSSGFQSFSGVLEGVNTALLGLIAFGGKIGGLVSGLGAFGAAMIGPQGIAVALGAATAAIISFLVPADKLADYAWPDWLAGYEGATPGTAAADIADGFAALTDRIKKWAGAVDDANPGAETLNNTLSKPIPVNQWDGAISAIARFEEKIQDNKNVYDSWFQIVAKPIPVSQWDGMISKLDELAGVTPEVSKNVGDLASNITKTEGVFNTGVQSADGYARAIDGISTVYSQVGEGTVKATGAFKDMSTALDKNGKSIDDARAAQDQFNKVLGGTGNDVAVVTAAFNTYLGALGSGAKLTTEQIIELTQSANDFKVAMEEIASNERIKLIEAKVSLDIAALESDTKKVEAAFESINATIQSTGEVLSGLYDNFAGTSGLDQLQFESWIDDENDRRDKALEKQNELIDAQIEQLEARTNALNRGDAIIKVDGAGLQPQLEAFMWEILRAIQVRASADMQEFLLGIAT